MAAEIKTLTFLLVLLILASSSIAFADTTVQLRDSAYSCRYSEGASQGQLLGVGSKIVPYGSIISKLKQAITKAKHKEKKFDAKRQGLPEAAYAAMELKYIRAHRKRRESSLLLEQVKHCKFGEFTKLDNWSDALSPATKQSWDPNEGFQADSSLPDESAEVAFSYDEINYSVFSRTIHGTQITVALHKSALSGELFSAAEFADVIFEYLHEITEMHAGFVTDRFVFKVRAPGESDGFALCRGGVVLAASAVSDMGLEQFHEMFHSLNGKTYAPVPDGTQNLFQVLTLIVEEFTVYYTEVVEAQVLGDSFFAEGFDYFWELYLSYRGGEYDLPYAQLADYASDSGTGASIYRSMMNARGMMVAYAIDLELRKQGRSLAELMEHLYLNFGLNETTYSLNDVQSALQTLGGSSLVTMFNDYGVQDGDLTLLLGGDPKFKLPQ